MRAIQCVGHLGADAQHVGRWQRAARDTRRQRFTVDELHHQVVCRALAADVVQRAYIRMIERRNGSGFALETGTHFAVRREMLREHFDRDVATQARVAGTVHFAHPARAQRRDDFVWTQFGSRCEHQWRSIRVGQEVSTRSGAGFDCTSPSWMSKRFISGLCRARPWLGPSVSNTRDSPWRNPPSNETGVAMTRPLMSWVINVPPSLDHSGFCPLDSVSSASWKRDPGRGNDMMRTSTLPRVPTLHANHLPSGESEPPTS